MYFLKFYLSIKISRHHIRRFRHIRHTPLGHRQLAKIPSSHKSSGISKKQYDSLLNFFIFGIIQTKKKKKINLFLLNQNHHILSQFHLIAQHCLLGCLIGYIEFLHKDNLSYPITYIYDKRFIRMMVKHNHIYNASKVSIYYSSIHGH